MIPDSFTQCLRHIGSRMRRTSPSRRHRRRRDSNALFACERLEDRLLLAANVLDDFAGQAFVDAAPERVIPPDTNLAVGPTHLVETVNRHVAFYNKSSGVEISSERLDVFFAETGTDAPDPPNGISVGFDPKVAYDELAGHFVVTALEVNSVEETSHLLIAVSKSSNPLDGWEMHRINAEDADKYWADWTALGWDADAYYVTVNMFKWGGSYDHHSVFTFDKGSLTDGDADTLTYFDVDRNGSHFTMWPALMHGAEAGEAMYFVEASASGAGSKIRVVKMTDKLSSDPTFEDFGVQVPNYSWAVNPTQPDGANFHITNIGTRMLSAAWRNDHLVTGHGVGSDGVAHARWYEIDTSSAKPSLIQSGEIDAGPGIHTYLPALDIAPNGDIGMTYVQSSTDAGDANGDGFKDGYLSMYVTGRKADDPLGTMQPPVLVKAGEATYLVEDQVPNVDVDPPPYRVGDFGGIVVDPVDGTFWAANEYATASLPLSPVFDANWGTWIVNFEINGGAELAATSDDLTALLAVPLETSGASGASRQALAASLTPLIPGFDTGVEAGLINQDPTLVSSGHDRFMAELGANESIRSTGLVDRAFEELEAELLTLAQI